MGNSTVSPIDRTAITSPLRLTSFSHGGGCGCKIAPGVLSEMLKHSGAALPPLLPPQLLVGIETADDAAVYQLNDEQALVATTDFFMPIVDDPFDFGRIAATNALSDVYAMGGQPIFALALVAMPVNQLPLEAVRTILAGGESVCRAAGIPIAGGHTIDSVEPIYGLVALGLVHPSQVKRNSSAQAGDVLILGKGLGVGIYSAALKKNELSPALYQAMLASTTQLNTPGQKLAQLADVHALTDVTGFGLLGHLLEICRGSGLSAQLDWSHVPLLPQALLLAQQGFVTGASARNWASYGQAVAFHHSSSTEPSVAADLARNVLTDPQTSGGLLAACHPNSADQVLELFHQQGFAQAQVIGQLSAASAVDAPLITVQL